MSMTRKKPEKPRKNFPLSPANNGQWCKKIKGRIHYFGVWADPAAEARFTAWRDTDPPRLEAMVDDQDVYLVGVPGPSDLDRFSARLNARGVELQATSWEA